MCRRQSGWIYCRFITWEPTTRPARTVATVESSYERTAGSTSVRKGKHMIC